MSEKWQCKECNFMMVTGEWLSAPNPFEENDTIIGCPNCKAVNELREICDESKCKSEATCGFPMEDGYRRTCYKHSVFARVPEEYKK